jgi:hypothetical protein
MCPLHLLCEQVQHGWFLPRIMQQVLAHDEGILFKRTYTDEKGQRSCSANQSSRFGIYEQQSFKFDIAQGFVARYCSYQRRVEIEVFI